MKQLRLSIWNYFLEALKPGILLILKNSKSYHMPSATQHGSISNSKAKMKKEFHFYGISKSRSQDHLYEEMTGIKFHKE